MVDALIQILGFFFIYSAAKILIFNSEIKETALIGIMVGIALYLINKMRKKG